MDSLESRALQATAARLDTLGSAATLVPLVPPVTQALAVSRESQDTLVSQVPMALQVPLATVALPEPLGTQDSQV